MVPRAKRQNGRYYTRQSPFATRAFKLWAKKIKIQNHTILEPFAGENSLIDMLIDQGYCKRFKSFDIAPGSKQVTKRDTISNFPTGHETCISNPPWLGQYSARRRGLHYPNIEYDDLYKHCLKLALDNCKNVGFIIPATFLHSELFRERLESVTFLNNIMFLDTENPVCLALFRQKSCGTTKIYYDNEYVDTIDYLEKYIPTPEIDMSIKFNDKNGGLGLVAIDNTVAPTIRFCKGSEITNKISFSSRSITRISVDSTKRTIDELNYKFNKFREQTWDVFLTPFKGLRKDGMYRRRLDYNLARKFVCQYAS